MVVHYRTRGFVFKKEEKGESDRVFSIFTDDFGRLDVFAKAIRKSASKLRGGIDIFYLSEVEFIQGKNRKTLTDATAIKKFDNISGDLIRLKVVCRIADILDSFIKGQDKDSAVFNLLFETFDKLEDKSFKEKNCQLAYQYFLWNFISLQGYKSEVNICASCRSKLNPYNIYFSNKEGGVVCKNCTVSGKSAERINSDVVKILRLILKKDWQTVAKLKIKTPSLELFDGVSENARRAFCPAHN